MFMFWGNWIADEKKFVDGQRLFPSEIIKNTSIKRRSDISSYYLYKTHWHSVLCTLYFIDAEMQQRYWTGSFLLPLGSIFILAVVVILMVLFKRCPHMVAAVVAGILGIILIFVILISLNHAPTYS